jgi:hypothetical protein
MYPQDPATVAAGGEVQLVGDGFDTIPAARLILTGPIPGNAETDVTAWLAVPPQPAPATLRTVSLPAATGAAPAGTPAPGRYTVRLEGTTAAADPNVMAIGRDPKFMAVGGRAFSTAEVPLSIAPGVSAAGGPLLAPTPAGSYAVAGTGFAANDLEVLLGTVPLQRANTDPPGAGEFFVQPNGTGLTIVPPAGLPAGSTYQVRVRAAGIEADPALWLAVP